MKHVLGISGLAKAGKDTLWEALRHEAFTRGYSSERFAIADALKNAVNSFLIEQFGIDIWNCSPEEKEIVRPILVDYGLIKRQQTNGTFLTNILQKEMDKSKADIGVITDIRYTYYPKDEVEWLKDDNNGKLIHLSRFENGALLKPPNEMEKINDPILNEESDLPVEWQTNLDKRYHQDHAKMILDFFEIV